MLQSMTEAFRQGNVGVKTVVAEHKVFTKPWPFSSPSVSAGKLVVWHGPKSKTCRVSNARLTCKKLRRFKLGVFAGQGHCVLFENFEKLSKLFNSPNPQVKSCFPAGSRFLAESNNLYEADDLYRDRNVRIKVVHE